MSPHLLATAGPNASAMSVRRTVFRKLLGAGRCVEKARLARGEALLGCASRSDLSKRSHFATDEQLGLVLLWDGFLTNRQDLEYERGTADRGARGENVAELLLRRYRDKGEAFAKGLAGHFCAIVADVREDTLLVAVDPFLTHPLYIRLIGDAYWVSNSVRTLAAVHPEAAVSGESLLELVYRQTVMAPLTMFKDIAALEPGTVTWLGKRARRYWSLSRELTPLSLDAALDAVESELERTIGHAEQGNRTDFVALSGGIDSSLGATILSRYNDYFQPTTVVVDWAGEAMDESGKAQAVASWLGRELREVRVHVRDFPSLLRAHVDAMDQPCPLGLGLSFLVLGVSDKPGVGLTGLGSDELFFGYPEVNQRLFGRTGADLADAYLKLSALFPTKTMEAFGSEMGVPFLPVYERLRQTFLEDVTELPETTEAAIVRLLVRRFLIPGDVYSHHLFASGHGIRAWHPFLDLGLVRLAGSLPTEVVATGAQRVGKPLLRHLARRVGLPRSIWAAPKHGFGVPAMTLVEACGDACSWFTEPSTQNSLGKLVREADSFTHLESGRQALSAYRTWSRLLIAGWLESDRAVGCAQ